MTLEEIKNLKDSIYELEGLLELAQLREDKIEELTPLIVSRLSMLTSMIPSSQSGSQTGKEAPSQSSPVKEPISSETAFIRGELDLQFDSDQLTPSSEQKDDTKVADEHHAQIKEHHSQIEEPRVTVERPERSEGMKPELHKTPIFCLNDRFRFRKSLFGGSEAEFANAMKMIAEMDSYEEAEQYFLESYNWNPEDPETIDFLSILSIYYDA